MCRVCAGDGSSSAEGAGRKVQQGEGAREEDEPGVGQPGAQALTDCMCNHCAMIARSCLKSSESAYAAILANYDSYDINSIFRLG